MQGCMHWCLVALDTNLGFGTAVRPPQQPLHPVGRYLAGLLSQRSRP